MGQANKAEPVGGFERDILLPLLLLLFFFLLSPSFCTIFLFYFCSVFTWHEHESIWLSKRSFSIEVYSGLLPLPLLTPHPSSTMYFFTLDSFSQIVAICYVEVEYLRPPFPPPLPAACEGWSVWREHAWLDLPEHILHLHLHFEAFWFMSCNWHEIFRLSAWWTDSLPCVGVALRLTKLTLSSRALCAQINHTNAHSQSLTHTHIHSHTLTHTHSHSHTITRPHTHFDGVQKLNYTLVKAENLRQGEATRIELMIGPFAPHKEHNNKRNLGRNPIKCPELWSWRAERVSSVATRRHSRNLLQIKH